MTSTGKRGGKTEPLEYRVDVRASMHTCYQGQPNRRSLSPVTKATPKVSGRWTRSPATWWLGLTALSKVYPAHRNLCSFLENFNLSHPNNASTLLYVQTRNFSNCCSLGLLPYQWEEWNCTQKLWVFDNYVIFFLKLGDGFFPHSQESRKPQSINVPHLHGRKKDWEKRSKSKIIPLCNSALMGFVWWKVISSKAMRVYVGAGLSLLDF